MKTTCAWEGCNNPKSGKHAYCDEHIKEYRRKWRKTNKAAKEFVKTGYADLKAKVGTLEKKVARLENMLEKRVVRPESGLPITD